MSNAETLNLSDIPWLGNIMEWSFEGRLQLGLLILMLTIGIGELAKLFEYFAYGQPFFRVRFYGYIFGDVCLAAAAFTAFPAIDRFQGTNRFYTSHWWYIAWLVVVGVVSIKMEVDAVRLNQVNPSRGYNLQQQFTPSKLSHTIFFGPVGAILGGVIAPILLVEGSWTEITGSFVFVIAWVLFNIYDSKRDMIKLSIEAHPHPSRTKQYEHWLISKQANSSTG